MYDIGYQEALKMIPQIKEEINALQLSGSGHKPA
jgi:hypothetical protein